jgi:hypothetical protein
LFLFLCFVSGAACFFVKHVQTGMCIHVTSKIKVNAGWGSLTFVELSNNCLDPAAQARFLDNSAMFNLKRKGCFEATRRSGSGYYLPMLYLLVATDPSGNCRDRDHAITQTSWGGLSVYEVPNKGTRCAVPGKDGRLATNPGIDTYIRLTTDCADAEEKRFNFGKLFLVVCSQFVLCLWGLRSLSRQSLSPLRSWVRFSLRTHVNALPKVVSFLRIPPTGKVDRVG